MFGRDEKCRCPPLTPSPPPSEFSPVLFRLVTSAVYSKYPTECTYKQFLSTTMSTLRKATSDPTFSIQLGHNIDRVVFTFPQYHDEKAYPNSLFLTVLTMAVYSTVQERIKLIYEVRLIGRGAGRGLGLRRRQQEEYTSVKCGLQVLGDLVADDRGSDASVAVGHGMGGLGTTLSYLQKF